MVISSACLAGENTIATTPSSVERPFYIGVQGGYGSTTWNGLVPSDENQGLPMSVSTPLHVEEGGGVWGFFAGYELLPSFAVEASYLKYPKARLDFDDTFSIFTVNHDGQTVLETRTETVSLMAKIMMYIPRTKVRIYSSVGAAGLHRDDLLNEDWRLTPTFGAGINYNINPRILGEIGANYTAGYGESEIDPTNSYYPFLYSVFFRLAYRF